MSQAEFTPKGFLLGVSVRTVRWFFQAVSSCCFCVCSVSTNRGLSLTKWVGFIAFTVFGLTLRSVGLGIWVLASEKI